ncbi:MAG: hypothetical protein JXA57_11155 [Armatimonadetes bacterium]|nr:hypothetical protein [Armatimonadota bacterium]
MTSRSGAKLSCKVIAGLLLAQAVLVATVVITSESLWIDEFGTAQTADVERLSDWWQRFRTQQDTDIQMPLYHIYMFIWGKLFGFSEYALRMANWPLFMLAQGVLIGTFRRTPLFAVSLLIVSTFHPMIWYYLNEARSYAMVFLGAVCTLTPMVSLFARLYSYERRIARYSPWTFSFGVIMLAGSNMLGMLWVGVAILLVVGFHLRIDREGLCRNRLQYSVLGVGLVFLSCFYAYTLLRGARGTGLYETSFGTLVFSGYELLGLSGLGPGRLDLRAGGAAVLQNWAAPLILGLTILGAGLLHGLKVLGGAIGLRGMAIFSTAALAPAVAISVAGFLMHWRVLGRHFMPEVPLVSALLALSVATLLRNGKPRALLLALIMGGTLIVSGISMTSPRHAKDDYRYAAAAAQLALEAGEGVWWAACPSGARYYGLPLQTAEQPGKEGGGAPIGIRQQRLAIAVSNLRAESLRSLPYPDLIVVSKPDAYDTSGTLRAWLAHEGFAPFEERPAFSFWRASATSQPSDY